MRRSTTIDLGKQLTTGPGQFVEPDSALRCAATRPHSRSVATCPSRPVSRAVPITARLHPRHHSSRLTSAVQRPHPSKTQPHFRPLTALK